MIALSTLVIALYLLATLASLQQLLTERPGGHWPLWTLAGGAVFLHLLLLFNEITALDTGQDLSLIKVASAVSWLVCLLLTLLCRRLNGWILLPVAYGFAILLLLVNYLIPGQYVTHLERHPLVLLHIALALSSYAVLILASLFTLLLAYLDHHLKQRKRVTLPGLPPLLTLEHRVMQLIGLGIVLLTLSIGSGWLFLTDPFSALSSMKAGLSMVAWCLYVLLLWGHHYQGWRGNTLILFSLLGSALLTLAYFGSRVIIEVLLA